jgi:hypothetical protein
LTLLTKGVAFALFLLYLVCVLFEIDFSDYWAYEYFLGHEEENYEMVWSDIKKHRRFAESEAFSPPTVFDEFLSFSSFEKK